MEILLKVALNTIPPISCKRIEKSSPLKQLGQMEPKLARSIYVRSKPGIDGPWVCFFQNCVHEMEKLYRGPYIDAYCQVASEEKIKI
jgi:hypothetical protein